MNDDEQRDYDQALETVASYIGYPGGMVSWQIHMGQRPSPAMLARLLLGPEANWPAEVEKYVDMMGQIVDRVTDERQTAVEAEQNKHRQTDAKLTRLNQEFTALEGKLERKLERADTETGTEVVRLRTMLDKNRVAKNLLEADTLDLAELVIAFRDALNSIADDDGKVSIGQMATEAQLKAYREAINRRPPTEDQPTEEEPTDDGRTDDGRTEDEPQPWDDHDGAD